MISHQKRHISISDLHDEPQGGIQYCPPTLAGMDHLSNPRLFKGLGFSLKERQQLGIHGLLPPTFLTMDEQAARKMEQLRDYRQDINKHIFLVELCQTNEKLFYKILTENIEELMPIVYTPTVGLACQTFGYNFRKPQGLFISIHDKLHIPSILRNWPENDVKAIVVTDGERILGLGDLGVQGMGIPVGKLALCTALGGVKPHQCLPITLDVGTNNEEYLNDPSYVGLRHPRITGQEYDDFIDAFMKGVVDYYGQDTLIQFEDFGNHNAFRMLEKYKDKYCTFNDDIQGTASVAVAGVLASLKATNTKLSDHTFVFQGAGEANIGIANLIVRAMEKREGVPPEEGAKRIWMKDSRGLIVKDRPSGGISSHKEPYAHDHAPIDDLDEIVKTLKPSVLIGAASIPNVFTKEIIEDMAELNKQPIIFALSNPTSQAECTAEEAYKWSEGRAIFASGSPFPRYELNGKIYEPGQGNNAYIFPGVVLGAISCALRHIDNDVFLSAAEAVARMVDDEDLAVGRIYPHPSKFQECSLKIATEIAENAYKEGSAGVYPEPEDKVQFVKKSQYNYNYQGTTSLPATYEWPISTQASKYSK